MVDERSEYYLNLVPGLKKWDMCASEAILKSRMGIISDSKQRPLEYKESAESYTLKDGIIGCANQKLYQLCMKRMEKQGILIHKVNQKIVEEIEKQKMLK